MTTGIVAPRSEGFFGGLSAAFSTSGLDKLDEGALVKDVVALHISLSHYEETSISTQVGLLRKGLTGGFGGERGKWFAKVAKVSLSQTFVENATSDICY